MAIELKWPEALPRPQLSNMTLNQATGLAVSEFSTGRQRARRLQNRPSTLKATWLMKESEAELFEAALEHTYLGVRFLMTVKLPRMDRYQELEVLFITDPRDNRKPISSRYWEYSAEISVKKLPQLDEGVTSLVLDMGVPLQQSVDLLDSLEYMLNG